MLGNLHAPSNLKSCDSSFLSQLEVMVSGNSSASIISQTNTRPEHLLAFSSLAVKVGKDFIEFPDFGTCSFKSQKATDNVVDEARIPAEPVDLIGGKPWSLELSILCSHQRHSPWSLTKSFHTKKTCSPEPNIL